jgi:hypothetical protein
MSGPTSSIVLPPKRVQILNGSGAKYFKAGQFGYIIAENTRGGMFWCNKEGHSRPGEVAYLVSKTKDMRGGALWFSRDALRFTKGRRR